eukprot:m.171304 g.171304  ORF g.171304 m.171304 type:complete len:709 (-) comp31645_c0_seq1:143-2269(-)
MASLHDMRVSVAVLLAIGLMVQLQTTQARLVRRDHHPKETLNETEARFERTRRSTFCESPKARQTVNFPESIIGRCHINYTMDSGYLPVTDQDFLFYWKFGPRLVAPKDAPIIFWTNGGPGCSSMEGAIGELGPLSLINSESKSRLFTGQLSDNPYSWNAYAHLVFVDQPRYVGFSYGSGPRITSSEDAGKDIAVFIKKFLKTYEDVFQDTNPEVYIAGESYAGHYVPAWSRALLKDSSINFKGIALGNSCVDDAIQIDNTKYREFLHRENLLPPGYEWEHTSTYLANKARNTYVGYTPNFYDFRVQKITCNGPCYDYDYTDYQNFLSSSTFTTALDICPGAGDNTFTGNAGGCISMGSFDRHQSNREYVNDIQNVLNKGLKVVFFYGKVDQACDYVGGRAMVDSLQFKGRDDFHNAKLVDALLAGAPATKMQQGGGLTWIEIESAGHMVPRDRPAAGFFAINHLVIGQGTLPETSSSSPPPPPPCPPCATASPTMATTTPPLTTTTACPTLSCAPCTTEVPMVTCPPQICPSPPSSPTTESPTSCPECLDCANFTPASTTTAELTAASTTTASTTACPPPIVCPTPTPTAPVTTSCPEVQCTPVHCRPCPTPEGCPDVYIPACPPPPPPSTTTACDPKSVTGNSGDADSAASAYPTKTVAGLSTALAILTIAFVVVMVKLNSSPRYTTLSSHDVTLNEGFNIQDDDI